MNERERALIRCAVKALEKAAAIIEDMTASASLYENAATAKAVIDFKKRAVAEIKVLAECYAEQV